MPYGASKLARDDLDMPYGSFESLERELCALLAESVPVYMGAPLRLEEATARFGVLDGLGDGKTLMMYAAIYGDLASIDSFLRNAPTPGAPALDARCDYGWTALCYAVVAGQVGACAALLKAKASVSTKDEHGNTALHLAARTGAPNKNYPKIIEMLLEAGASISAVCDDGWLPMHEGCWSPPFHGNSSYKDLIVFQLLRAGSLSSIATVNDESSPLHLVCESSSNGVYGADIIQLLLAFGADANAVDTRGDHPLHLLVTRDGTSDMVSSLTSFKTLDFSPRRKNGETPLHMMPANINPTFEMLLQNGADVNAQDTSGNTPLHAFASQSQYLELNFPGRGIHDVGLYCCALLLANGADLDILNAGACTAFDEAVLAGDDDFVRLIRDEYTRRAERRDVCVAFASGLHDRLGNASCARVLDAEMVRMILQD